MASKTRSAFLCAAILCAACSFAAAADKHQLAYKFTEGELIRSKVVHLATTETRIQGTTQESESRGVSEKEWRIVEVSASGEVTFEHRVTRIDMRQHISGRPQVAYNSDKDKRVPVEYEKAAASVGKVIAQVTIAPHGEVIKRVDHFDGPTVSMGMANMVTPLPKEAVEIGAKWYFPVEIRVKDEGQVKRIKTRQKYVLEKVVAGLATIRVTTQVLTPINSPRIEAQLIQQLNNGIVKFDIDRGRVISQRYDWDEQAIGFSGADSAMDYLARYEETMLADDAGDNAANKPADKPAAKTAAKPQPTDVPRPPRQ
ncbi:MAG: hypothetical protein QGG36_28005 [Pirellulaceae bacterium]|jgi:hypothetical protein|nr:hypothetical protein [Pirellulaceae bacterium]MDP7019673.1 hypothetical protein [Pirellulaceae bacterium]